ncbi:MAG TPA: AGE family epimerase/isomerase [Caulobacteraceae bacterium]|nr:AGE family epimerase/isomerase [Caulobacteraceae bacterium]
MASPKDDAREVLGQLKGWLLEHAYPLWAAAGRDQVNGGFFEKIAQDGGPVEAPRRARVVTRQTFAYAVAGQLGWEGDWRACVEEGLKVLIGRYLREDGLFRVLVSPGGNPVDENPAPYEQAFALLALSAACKALGVKRGFEARAVRTREALQARLGRPDGGFYETLPHTGPLRANPHMHLFEAAQAWMAVGEDDGWRRMAQGIGALALERMIQPGTGALGELFEDDWTPVAGADVEPGHQFEWGWLLLRFGAKAEALRLIDVAEAHGVDHERGVAFNALGADLTPRDTSARLWPQSERLKAGVAAALETGEDRYWAMAASAGRGLQMYLGTDVPGLWRDRMNADGTFVDEPAPASSFYHIVGAILDLDAALA